MKQVFRTIPQSYATFLICCAVAGIATVQAEEKADDDSKTALTISRLAEGRPPRNPNELIALQERILDISDLAIKRTVAVQVGRANGSGVIVSKDGYILTAAHVAGTPDKNAWIFLSNGQQVRGKTLGLNEVLDAGLIKITDPGVWDFAKLGQSSKLKSGQWCIATGHPGGYDTKTPAGLAYGPNPQNREVRNSDRLHARWW